MRSSLAIAALAVGAIAVPFNKERDYVIAYDVVTHYEVVTVTPDAYQPKESPAPPPAHYGHHNWGSSGHTTTIVQTTPTPQPYVAPSSTSTTSTAEAQPTTYAAPSSTSTTSTAEAQPTTYAAPSSTSTTSTAEAHPTTYAAPAATSQASSSTGQAPTDYQGLVTYHHNLHRANHTCSDLEWDDGLAASAQTIAESCVYAHNTEVDGGGYGQNIAAGVAAENISAIITDLFYNSEEPYFASEYGKADPDMTNFEKWGHFSQIVWKGSTHVGCATVQCPNGLANVGSGVEPVFTVCNYKNPGNYAGENADNVLKPLGYSSANWNTGS